MSVTFAQLLRTDGVSRTWLFELSNDDFATVSHRWATNACHYNGDQFQGRIAKIGRITKAFGLDNLPVASNFQLIVDNNDQAADFLCDVSNGPVELTYRFRLSLGLFDPKAEQTLDVEPTTRVMGTFGLYNAPARGVGHVELQLADDGMGRFSELAASPTINEWITDAGTTGDTCLLYGQNPTPVVDFNVPMPLAWGPFVQTSLAAVKTSGGSIGAQGAAGALAAAGFSHTLIVCATTSADAVNANDVTDLSITYRTDAVLNAKPWASAGSTWSVPQTFDVPKNNPQGFPDGTYTIWEALKSDVIVKDGHNWKVLWVAIDSDSYWVWAVLNIASVDLGGAQPDGSVTASFWVPPTATGENLRATESALDAIETWTVKGFPFSAQTNKTSPTQRGLDVILDLLSFYSHGSVSDVDTTSFAVAAKTNEVYVQNVIQPLEPEGTSQKFLTPVAAAMAPGSLRQVLSDIAQSIGVDFFFTWAGKLAVAAGWFDFASVTNTPLDISEVNALNIKDRKPSAGERWTYYNRIYVIGQDGVKRGPYDNAQAITDVGVIVPKILQGKWLMPDASAGIDYDIFVWQLWPRLEAKQRSLLSFTALKEILQIDLAGLFTFTWTRGNTGAVYDGSVFRLESIAINPTDLSVDIEGIWVDDITTINPYLLDTESFTLRVAAGGGRTVTVTDGNDIVDFSSGDLNSDGVVAGDILLLLDTTLAANVFSRYRALRILAVSGAGDQLQVVDADLDFDAPSGTAVGAWVIYRGATTYPNFASDPTHYPSGSKMYGKVTDSTGVFSDSSPGNQLLEG